METAVEWLETRLRLGLESRDEMEFLIATAKAIERKQIIDALIHGVHFEKSAFRNPEEYIKETFKKK